MQSGQVHALLGENGAGKTTLMNIAMGIVPADAGSISVNGRRVSIRSPRAAGALGLGMVYQHYRLVERLTVAQNLAVGWPGTKLVFSRAELERSAAETAERIGLNIDPGARICDLSQGEQQRVAILRALSRGARILILDEPTAVHTPQEVEQLFGHVRRIAADGAAVIFISHKLREVMAVADRVSVLRAGRLVASLPRDQCAETELASLTVGGAPTQLAARPAPRNHGRLVNVESVSVDGDDGRVLHELSFEVNRGEILGVAGVAGNGQTELAELLAGLRTASAGTLREEGDDVGGARPDRQRVSRIGIGHIPEQHSDGLALQEPIEFSSVLRVVDESANRRGPFLRRGRLHKVSSELLDAAGLGSVHSRRVASTLSGGQMQRLLVHREIRGGTRLVIAVHPTRGLDVGATRSVRNMLLGARAEGVGVVLLSEDLDELFEISDRLVVLFEGAIAGELERSQFDPATVGLLMGGGARPPAVSGGGERSE